MPTREVNTYVYVGYTLDECLRVLRRLKKVLIGEVVNIKIGKNVRHNWQLVVTYRSNEDGSS